MILLGLRNIYVVRCSFSLGYDELKLILVGFASQKAPTIESPDHHDFTLYCLFWVAVRSRLAFSDPY